MNRGKLIVLCYNDGTLGGTSRSALLSAMAWRLAEYEVAFHPFSQAHASRVAQMQSIGRVLNSLDQVDWSAVAAVHFHHGSFTLEQKANFLKLLACVEKLENAPVLISNNIFAVNDSVLDLWPARRAVCLLGKWALAQYQYSSFLQTRPALARVVPNAQDTRFFRFPTPAERKAARVRTSLDPFRVALRVGSPLADKWSDEYVGLAPYLKSGERLVLIGPPPHLVDRLQPHKNVLCLPPIADDVLLRDYYWSADVFAHSARRGESFGNVIFEALLCGLPVVYRSRPLRDNTPWELKGKRGFSYVPIFSGYAWARKVCGLLRNPAVEVDPPTSYCAETVAKLQAECLQTLIFGGKKRYPSNDLSARERLAVVVRHNPVTAKIKKIRLERMSGKP